MAYPSGLVPSLKRYQEGLPCWVRKDYPCRISPQRFIFNHFNSSYPKNPQNFGEQIRKARMDKGLMIKELASQLGVTEDTVINWEIRDIEPAGRNLEKVQEFIKNSC